MDGYSFDQYRYFLLSNRFQKFPCQKFFYPLKQKHLLGRKLLCNFNVIFIKPIFALRNFIQLFMLYLVGLPYSPLLPGTLDSTTGTPSRFPSLVNSSMLMTLWPFARGCYDRSRDQNLLGLQTLACHHRRCVLRPGATLLFSQSNMQFFLLVSSQSLKK